MADTLSPTDSNTEARRCSSHTLRSPLLTYSCLLSLKSPPDVSFPFRGQRKLNQICPQGSLFDGERGEESAEEVERRGSGQLPYLLCPSLHTLVGYRAKGPSRDPLGAGPGNKTKRSPCQRKQFLWRGLLCSTSSPSRSPGSFGRTRKLNHQLH